MHILGEIPFVKPQNHTETTDKWLKMMKNEIDTYLFLVDLLNSFSTGKPKKQKQKSLSLIFHCF